MPGTKEDYAMLALETAIVSAAGYENSGMDDCATAASNVGYNIASSLGFSHSQILKMADAARNALKN